MATPSDGDFWSPRRYNFDFTFKFEETIFSLAVSTAFVAISPVVIHYYSNQAVYIRRNGLLWAKLLVALLLCGSEAAALAIWSTASRQRTDTTIPAVALDLLAALVIGAVTYMEHVHTLRSSAPFTIYLLAGALMDVIKARSCFLRPGLEAMGGLAVTSAALKTGLLVLQEIPKQAFIADDRVRENATGEATSGYLTRIFLLLLAPVFAIGFRGQLLMGHLMRLDSDFDTELLFRQLNVYWSPENNTARRQTDKSATGAKLSLVKACFMAWKSQLAGLVVARLVVTAFNFAQPYLLQSTIQIVGISPKEPTETQKRGGLMGASIIVFLGGALSKANFAYLMNRLVTRLRGGVVALMFEKQHKLTEADARNAAAVTLMTADLDGVAAGVPLCLELPIGALEIGLGIYCLSGFVGLSAFAVFGPLIVSTLTTYLIGLRLAKLLAAWNKNIQGRIAKASQLLPQLMLIKMLGLGPTVGAVLQHARIIEIESSKSFRALQAASVGPILLGDLMTAVVVIAAALFGAAFNGKMVSEQVFPTLAVVSLIQRPLAAVLLTVPTVSGMLACFSRIQEFLCREEATDCRTLEVVEQTEATNAEVAHTNGIAEFRACSYGRIGDEQPLMKTCEFTLDAGSVTGVIGATGGGKSSLINALLGQSTVFGGQLFLRTDDIGYCAQQLWLRDATIRENIVGYAEYDEEKFNKVIQACMLERDLAWLPNGADYVVGPNGSNLSGGQRQRVALARAGYSEAKLTILDDSFSSLDKETAVSVLKNLCGPDGLLRGADRAVVFATYLPESLDVGDQFIVISDGTAELRQKHELDEQKNDLLVALSSCAPALEKTAEEKALQPCTSMQPNEADGSARRKGNFSLYMLFINPIGRLKTVCYGVLVSLFAAGEIIPRIYVQNWIRVGPENSLYFIGYMLIVVATCLIGILVYWLLHTKLSPRSSASLHERLVRTTMGSTLHFFSTTKTGELVNRYGQDMTLLSRNLPASFLRTIYAGSSAAINMGIILSGATYLAAMLPVVVTALFFIQRYYLRTSRQIRHLDLEAKAPLFTYFQETASGLDHIRGFRWQQQNIKHGYTLLEQAQVASYAMALVQLWLALVLSLLSAVMGITLIALALFASQSSSQSAIGLSFLSLIMISYTLEQTLLAWANLETTSGALARLAEFEANTPQERSCSSVALQDHWPSKGKVVLEDVSAYYTRGDDHEPALKNVSLTIAAGQRVCVAGHTGSGKSTLLLTLLGFVEYDGKIEIDGVDISKLACDELRSRMVVITQDQVQFEGTVRMNLLPLTMNNINPSTQEDEEKVARKDAELEQLLTSLSIWEPLASKGGLYAKLEDAGYSKGQLQLLCIARAITKQRDTGYKLVLVDEATSSIDGATEKIVNRVMRENFTDCTVLSIAHREMGNENVDRVIRLQRGTVLPSGTELPAAAVLGEQGLVEKSSS